MPAARKPSRRPRRSRLLELASALVEVTVTESTRARKLRLSVGRAGPLDVAMTVPRRTTEAEIDRFLRDKADWVAQTLSGQRERACQLGLARPGVVWRLGEPLPLVRIAGERSRAMLGRRADGELAVGLAGPRAQEAPALERFLRAEARRVAQAMIAREQLWLGVQVTKLRIADQRSRWGSANENGVISLNWRLLLAPAQVFDYVVVHELCHLVETNHSKRFWSLVETRRSDYRRWDGWLDRHGPELRLWSAAHALR